jgi:hypothetical protein
VNQGAGTGVFRESRPPGWSWECGCADKRTQQLIISRSSPLHSSLGVQYCKKLHTLKHTQKCQPPNLLSHSPLIISNVRPHKAAEPATLPFAVVLFFGGLRVLEPFLCFYLFKLLYTIVLRAHRPEMNMQFEKAIKNETIHLPYIGTMTGPEQVTQCYV